MRPAEFSCTTVCVSGRRPCHIWGRGGCTGLAICFLRRLWRVGSKGFVQIGPWLYRARSLVDRHPARVCGERERRAPGDRACRAEKLMRATSRIVPPPMSARSGE